MALLPSIINLTLNTISKPMMRVTDFVQLRNAQTILTWSMGSESFATTMHGDLHILTGTLKRVMWCFEEGGLAL